MRRSTKILTILASALPMLLTRAASAQTEPAPEAAPPADDAAMLGEEDPARPPPDGKGVIWGVVSDAKTKEPVIDAQVSVVGTNKKVVADFDGRFRLELPPGNYELRVFYQLYKAQRVQNVRVAAGKVEKVDVALSAEESKQEIVVEVEADPDRASAAAQTLIRKNSATVGDAVSAQEIAKTPDRNAADAAKRVVGATVVGQKYVFVRGLGERYTNALLNGTPLPSPEPDKQAVPFDLFPTSVLSDLTIVKTFAPDMPGDFTGGSVRVSTRELPEKLTVSGTFNIGINTESTFRQMLTYRGGSLDWLGVDDGTRALPPSIPNYRLGRNLEKPDGTTITNDELTAYGRAINAYMTTQRKLALPNMSGNVTIGNTHKIGDKHEIGYLAALTYGRRFQIREGEILRTFGPEGDGVKLMNDYRAETGTDVVSWGGYGGLTYRYAKDHKIALIGLYSRSSENEAREIAGQNEEVSNIAYDTRLRFSSRQLAFGQITGEHKLRNVNDATLDYSLTTSVATSDDPDMRENVYQNVENGRKLWLQLTQSGMHFFAEQSERIYGGQFNWTQPIVRGDAPIRVKFGGFALSRGRDFSARRFRFVGLSGFDRAQPPDVLFSAENIGTGLRLDEWTRTSDSYTAEHTIYAGYAMSDTSITKWMRVIVGGRVEASAQKLTSFDRFNPDARGSTELSTVDLLPSLNFVLKTSEKSNLRFSATRTVARPQLRELAPFLFTEYFGARDNYGNEHLDRTSIANFDARFEYFPTLAEVAALSVFYKDFTKPIEKNIIASGGLGTETYQNAAGAKLFGVELELRKNLAFAHPKLADFGALANVSVVWSRVELDPAQGGIQTNADRPLAGQSPFVVNAGVDYANDKSGTRARVLYNVFGRRLSGVGSYPLDDVYEQPRHLLDVTVAQRIGKHVDLKLSAENLLFAPVRFTQGADIADDESNVIGEYQPGATFTLGVTVQN